MEDSEREVEKAQARVAAAKKHLDEQNAKLPEHDLAVEAATDATKVLAERETTLKVAHDTARREVQEYRNKLEELRVHA